MTKKFAGRRVLAVWSRGGRVWLSFAQRLWPFQRCGVQDHDKKRELERARL